MANKSDETQITKADFKELLGKTEERLKAYVDNAVTTSREEVLDAVNNGFTAMQGQINGMQGQLNQIKATQTEHTATLAEHTAILEEHSSQLTSIQSIQRSELSERDRQEKVLKDHGRRINALEAAKTA